MLDRTARKYAESSYRGEKYVAFSWLLILTVLAIGGVYQRLGQPAVELTTPAEATVTQDAAYRE